MQSSLLYESADKSVVLIDIPRSLEEAQVLAGNPPPRRLVSCKALTEPWQRHDSKKGREPSVSQSPSAAIDELMTQETVRAAIDQIGQSYTGHWCFSRLVKNEAQDTTDIIPPKKRKLDGEEEGDHAAKVRTPHEPGEYLIDERPEEVGNDAFFFPTKTHHLLGSIENERAAFLQKAPAFDLILLDPPWPSRSVRRKRESYATAYDMHETKNLLSLIPVAAHLNPDGLVALWVTNKPAVIDLLRSPGGIFDLWGLEPIGEWIWVKVTNSGEPIVDPQSSWRKPWERLLIARKKGGTARLDAERKVIFGVPDLHSRKPNLRRLFGNTLPEDYVGLEIFARNLTAGWWSWGDQTLMFQHRHHWIEEAIADENVVDKKK
ncbi:hypothetical protein JX266_008103 [Neoarthrinium moseri]|nr:hypothetical protein JX266_008103 [Neoarthrinium moseri]